MTKDEPTRANLWGFDHAAFIAALEDELAKALAANAAIGARYVPSCHTVTLVRDGESQVCPRAHLAVCMDALTVQVPIIQAYTSSGYYRTKYHDWAELDVRFARPCYRLKRRLDGTYNIARLAKSLAAEYHSHIRNSDVQADRQRMRARRAAAKPVLDKLHQLVGDTGAYPDTFEHDGGTGPVCYKVNLRRYRFTEEQAAAIASVVAHAEAENQVKKSSK